MTDRLYRAQIYTQGSTSLSTANVDFTVGVNALGEAPIVSGGRVRLLEGRVEAVPATVVINDTTSGGLTSHLGDAGGRNTMLNRFVQFQRADAGGAYTAIGGGRITDLVNSDNIAQYRMTVNPEWPTGANTLCFTTNTTHLYPPCPDPGGKRIGFYGVPYRYGYVQLTRVQSSFAGITKARAVKFWLVQFRSDNPPVTSAGFDAIAGDLGLPGSGLHSIYSTKGAFHYLRFNVGGTDYPVCSFRFAWQQAGGVTGAEWAYPTADGPLPNAQDISDHQQRGTPLRFIIAASSTSFQSGGVFSSSVAALGHQDYAYDHGNPFLHMMGAPASPATPCHIFAYSSAVLGPTAGSHPMQVLKDLLAGAYSHSTVPYQLPLYSTAVFTGSADLRKLPMPPVAFRLTTPAPMQDWIQTNLCAPFGVMPTMDVTGAVRFTNFRVPGASTTSTGFSTAGLFKFTSTNLMAPHPDWRLSRNEACTVLNLTVNSLVKNEVNSITNGAPNLDVGGDGILAQTRTTTFYHDRYLQMGAYPVSLQYTGIPLVAGYQDAYVPIARYPTVKLLAPYLANEVFSRFGDGPVMGTLHALSAASTVRAGDITAVKLGTYPNYGTNARGGTRLVQILSKTFRPDGYDYDYLDIGPAQAASSVPTLTLSAASYAPKSHLKAVIGNVPSSGSYVLHLAQSTSATAPASASTLWRPMYAQKGGGTVYLDGLPSGSYFWGRAQNRQPGRALSKFTVSSARVATSAISAPTGLKTSNIKAQTANSTWVAGDLTYPVAVYVDDSTSAVASSGNLYAKYPANTQRSALAGLTKSHVHKIAVRHYDPYGGVSASLSSAFTTPSTVSGPNIITPPPMAGFFTVAGAP